MNDMRLRGEAIDLLTVSEYLRHEGTLQSIGGPAYLARTANSTPTAMHAEVYARLIGIAARRRDLLTWADTVRDMAYDESTVLDAVLDTAHAELANVSAMARREGIVELSALTEIAVQQIERRMEGLDVRTVTTGLVDLDAKLGGGWWLGKVHYAQARPQNGKSLLAKNAALNAAKAGVPTLLISTEIPRDEVVQELIAIEAGLSSESVKLGNLTGEQFGRLLDATTAINRLPLVPMGSRQLTAAALQDHVEQQVREAGIQFVIVDYLQNMWVDPRLKMTRTDQIDYFSRSIVTITQQHNIAMLATAQAARRVEDRQDKRPTLQDGDGSSKIEKDPDVVMSLFVPSRYDPDAYRGDMELIVQKNRLTARYGAVHVYIDPVSERMHNGVRRDEHSGHRDDHRPMRRDWE